MIDRRPSRGRGLRRRECRGRRAARRPTRVLEVRRNTLRGDWEVFCEGAAKPMLFRQTKSGAVEVARAKLSGNGGGEIQLLNETGKVAERVWVFR